MNAASLFLAPSFLHGGRETCKNCESRKGKNSAADIAPLVGCPSPPPSPVSLQGPGQNPPPQRVTPEQQPSRGCPSLRLQLRLCPTGPLRPWCSPGTAWAASATGPEESTAVSSKKLFQSLVGPGLSSRERRKCMCVCGDLPFLGKTVLGETF